jgi:hypothetical protein
MSRVLPGWSGLLMVGLAALAVPEAGAQKPKEPAWSHAFDLKCRPYGKSEFDDKTPKFGVEVFKDNNTNLGVYISQVGSIGVAPGFESLKAPLTDSKGPSWLSGLDLPARKFGVAEFGKDTAVHAMETFRDVNTANWIYVTEKGLLGLCPGKKDTTLPSSLRSPKWMHSVDLRCRQGGVKEWKDAKKYGIEIYRDNNTGNLVYIVGETGAIAVVPGTDVTPPPEGKAPEWLHGLDLQCRKHNEPDFTKDTRKFGLEVFRDENNGNLIYISDVGTLAVVSPTRDLKAPTANVKQPSWTHGLNLKCRKAGEKEFTEKTQVFGAEIFRDENTGVMLYIAENGSIGAAKQ